MAHRPSSLYAAYLTNHLRQAYGPAAETMRRLKKAYHTANVLPCLQRATVGPLLEVGPGFGEFLEVMLENDFRVVYAVDISDEVVAHIRDKHPSVVCEKIEDLADYLRSKPSFFQNIVMIDVMEHLPKDEVLHVLRAAREALRPGARLVVQTVNMASPMAGNEFWSDYTHTWGYTELSLREVLVMAGFSQIEVFGYRFPPGLIGSLRSLLRLPFQGLFWFYALANGMTRFKNMDPALIGVATRSDVLT